MFAAFTVMSDRTLKLAGVGDKTQAKNFLNNELSFNAEVSGGFTISIEDWDQIGVIEQPDTPTISIEDLPAEKMEVSLRYKGRELPRTEANIRNALYKLETELGAPNV